MAQETIAITVTGKVQGVGFRVSAMQHAQKLQIVGYARNEKDGTVQIVAQGEASALDALTDWVYQGPPRAEVVSVRVLPSAEGPFDHFHVY